MNAPTYELGDWFSNNIPNWEAWLASFVGRPIGALELGTCEGRSARWLLEHVLTHEDSKLVCVDRHFAPTCYPNLRSWKKRVFFTEKSSVAFFEDRYYERTEFAGIEDFELIYIDAGHEAKSVLRDAVFAWEFLGPGGILIFDDYPLVESREREWDRPGPAIDAFLSAYRLELELLPDAPNAINPGWQKAVRKLR